MEKALRKQVFLPVCRLSDGEYRFLFREQPPSRRLAGLSALKAWGWYLRSKLREGRQGFYGVTPEGVVAGRYAKGEVSAVRAQLFAGLEFILTQGIAAAHLTFGPKPFQEHFHPALGRWLKKSGHTLTFENYVPFYFVYALLSSPAGEFLFHGKRIGIIHSATGEKRQALETTLRKKGAKSVHWHLISAEKSATEILPADLFSDNIDIVFIGAGVGKLALFSQLRHFRGPVIDAGCLFEMWYGVSINRPFIFSY